MMNAGEVLDTIIHSVRVDPDLLAKPYLRPLYDEPEFVVRNIWRQFGGWWDGAPSRLKPSPDAQLAAELADARRGRRPSRSTRAGDAAEPATSGSRRHLADLAGWAAPDDRAVHGVRADVYRARRAAETSLMAKGIFAGAMRESKAVADPDA